MRARVERAIAEADAAPHAARGGQAPRRRARRLGQREAGDPGRAARAAAAREPERARPGRDAARHRRRALRVLRRQDARRRRRVGRDPARAARSRVRARRGGRRAARRARSRSSWPPRAILARGAEREVAFADQSLRFGDGGELAAIESLDAIGRRAAGPRSTRRGARCRAAAIRSAWCCRFPRRKLRAELELDAVELNPQLEASLFRVAGGRAVTAPVLALRGLRTSFDTPRGRLPAVDRVDLELFAGETLGVVGESGCGKSVTALSILRLLPQPPASIESGEILFEGRDLLKLSDEEMRHIRGNRIAMIFQEPMTCLNPVFRIGDQIGEALTVHRTLSRTERDARVLELLELVGISEPRKRARSYPHQLSGGMRQRVMIAMALANDPGRADRRRADHRARRDDPGADPRAARAAEEPLRDGGAADHARPRDRGRERGAAGGAVRGPRGRDRHGARDLRAAAPPLHRGPARGAALGAHAPGEPLHAIAGRVPDLVSRPTGCSFRERCTRALDDLRGRATRRSSARPPDTSWPVTIRCRSRESRA